MKDNEGQSNHTICYMKKKCMPIYILTYPDNVLHEETLKEHLQDCLKKVKFEGLT